MSTDPGPGSERERGLQSGSELERGMKIGRFVIEDELGAGGMGVVFAAHDRELDRRVAVKVLRVTVATDEAQRMRLLREGQAMARVTHPNVITVFEVGVEGRLVFLAQELLDGGTLGAWLAQRRTEREILAKFIAAGRGLAAAHAAGLVHRDFKPENVLLGKDGRVRVSDFGLARAVDAETTLAVTATRPDALARTAADLGRSPMAALTRTGTVMGTPLFMAPEQHRGDATDERSDQFSFCVALYHALYGAWPFAGKTAIAVADAVIHGRVEPPPKGSKVPGRLRKILLRGLSRAPEDRYPSMEALLRDLRHDPSRIVRRGLFGFGLGVVIAGAGIAGYVASRDGRPPAVVPSGETAVMRALLPQDAAAQQAFIAGRDALRGFDYRTAKAQLATALQHEPSFAPAHVALARAHEGLFDPLAAHASARQALAHAGSLPADAQLEIKGQAHEQLGELEKARDQYRRLFELHPDDLEYGLMLLRVQPASEIGRTAEQLRKLPAPAGDDPRIDLGEAIGELAKHDPTRAVELARRASARSKQLVLADARMIEGDALTALGELSAATAAYEEARRLSEASRDPRRQATTLQALGTLAIERGELAEAFAKFDAAGELARTAGQPAPEPVAWASSAFARALEGKLDEAELRLHEAEAVKPRHAQAAPHLDLVAAYLALARGDGATARARSQRALDGFAARAHPLAALCHQLQGELHTAAARTSAARDAYDDGLELARKLKSQPRIAMLELMLAELELDFGKPARAAAKARELQPGLAAAGATAASAQAWVLIARGHLAQQQLAEAQQALAHVDAATLQVFPVRARHQLAAAQVEIALHGDAANPEALEQTEAVRAEAEKLGWPGLVLEARLARVAILWAIESEEAAEETRVLVEDATARGDARIVRLAHPFAQR